MRSLASVVLIIGVVLGLVLNVFQVASSYPEGSPFSQGRRKSQLARAKKLERWGTPPGHL